MLNSLGLYIQTMGAIAIYDIFLKIKVTRVLPDRTTEYLINCA